MNSNAKLMLLQNQISLIEVQTFEYLISFPCHLNIAGFSQMSWTQTGYAFLRPQTQQTVQWTNGWLKSNKSVCLKLILLKKLDFLNKQSWINSI